MLKIFISVFLSLFVEINTSAAQSSETFTVGGKIEDSGQLPVPDAVVLLCKSIDSAVVKTAISDQKGSYVFEGVYFGEYFVRVETVDNNVVTSKIFHISGQNSQIPLVTIPIKEQNIEEVTITKKKPYIQREQGKLIVNVENSISSSGSSAFEIIEKSPGVQVQNGDNLVLNGKQGIVVQLDNKSIPMNGTELANFLRGIPSESIEKIEFVTAPSSKYDASGSAIIQIKLKKDKRIGTNGTITSSVGHGRYVKLGEGFSINHRNKKMNIYGSYNYAYRKAFNQLELERRFYTDNVFNSAYIQENYLVFPFRNHIMRAGMDYVLNPKNSISFVLNGVSNQFNQVGENVSDVQNQNEQIVSRFETTNDSKDKWYNLSGNFNFRHNIDTLGSEITFDLDYAYYGNQTYQNFDTRYYDLNDVEYLPAYLLYGDLTGNLAIYAGKTDYSKNFKNGDRLESGLKSSYVIADNNLRFYDKSNGMIVFDSTKSNHFIYKENINAFYGNWFKGFKRWNFQFGLRVENTNVEGDQLVSNTSFDTSYVQIFPSITTSYKLNDANNFDLNFFRRIDRPGYDQLNPFKFYLDPTTYKEGNPYLRPQTTYTIELAHLWKERYYNSLSVSRTYNNITEVIAPSPFQQNITVQTNVNLDFADVYTLTSSIPVEITKWWNSTNNFSFYIAQYSGNVANTRISARGNFTYNINSVNNFTINKFISAEISGNYQAKEIYAYDVIRPRWMVSAGIQSKILKNKGVLKLNVSDAFFTGKIQADVAFTDYKEHFLVTRETRVATLAFSYRFGNSNVPANRRRNGGAEDLKERVKGTMG